MIPSSWKRIPLGRAGDWFCGGTPSKANPDNWVGTIPWVSPKDMKRLRIADAEDHLSESAAAGAARVVPPGSVLVVVRGMILAHSFPVARTTVPVAFNQDMRALVPAPELDGDFVLYWLESQRDTVLRLVDVANHGTKRLPSEQFFALSIPVPPLPEQRKIAAILSSVDETIQKAEAVIAQLDVVKKAMLEELLTHGLPGLGTAHWRPGAVHDFGRVDGGRQLAPKAQGTARPYLRVANVFDGMIDSTDVKSMPLTDAEFERFRLRVGDVLLNEGQSIELVGRAALYRGDPPACAFQNSLIRFQAGPDAVPEFMEQLFRHWQRIGAFRAVAKQTTSIAHLGVSRFASMALRLPPRVEQQRIAGTVGSLDMRSCSEAKARDALLKAKKALADVLLSGTVRTKGESAA